jgi:Cu/Zn superoxide dismutase
MKSAGYSIMIAAVIAMSGTAFAQAPSPPAAVVTVVLAPQNSSGESGTAALTQVGNDIVVTTKMTGAGTVAQPIHIHDGTCATLNPAPKYPLTTVQNGTSTTTLKDMKLSSLETGNYAINVHKSTDDVKTYVACGNIPKAAAGT